MKTPLGLTAERTALAWQRTGVAGIAVAGSALVAAAHLGTPGVIVTTALVLVLVALAVVVAAVATRPAAADGSAWVRLLAVAGIPVLLAPAGILLALLS